MIFRTFEFKPVLAISKMLSTICPNGVRYQTQCYRKPTPSAKFLN